MIIDIKDSANYIIVELKDNGSGIDDSIIKKVFLPFYTTKEGGSGIGLSLTRKIMFANGGNIEIESLEKENIIKRYFIIHLMKNIIMRLNTMN